MQFSLRSRPVIAAILLLLFAVFAFNHLPAGWQAVTLLVAIGGAHEWGRLCGFSGGNLRLYVAAFVIFALLASMLGSEMSVQYAHLVFMALFWVIFSPWWILKRWSVNQSLLSALGLLILYAVWRAAVFLYEYDFPLLLAGLGLVWIFDSACYYVGRTIGTVPLAPAVSPKKTMEGFLGGLYTVCIGGMIYNHYWAAEKLPLIILLCAVFGLVILALLGDLFISALKRHVGVKDTGGILGEHGGILDRIDSLLPVLPAVALLSPWSG